MSEHFQPKEFASKDGRPSPYPLVVQEGLYQLLEEIRDEFGKPIVVNSGYRSPEHNKNIGGAKNSYHVKGMAADIRPQHGPDFQRELKRLKQIANKKCYGGVGSYPTFVHVDFGSWRRWNG